MWTLYIFTLYLFWPLKDIAEYFRYCLPFHLLSHYSTVSFCSIWNTFSRSTSFDFRGNNSSRPATHYSTPQHFMLLQSTLLYSKALYPTASLQSLPLCDLLLFLFGSMLLRSILLCESTMWTKCELTIVSIYKIPRIVISRSTNILFILERWLTPS